MGQRHPNILIGLLSMGVLMGAPLRFSVLNETSPRDRGAAQGLLNVFFSVGRLLGAAVGGGVAATHGGGTIGYQAAFFVMGIPAAAMVFVATRLKSRRAEQEEDTESLAAQSA